MRPRPPRLRPQWPVPLYAASRSRGGFEPASIQPLGALLQPINHQQIRTIRSIDGKSPKRSRYNHNPNHPPLAATQAAAYERKVLAGALPLRTGVIATKKGMTAIYDAETGTRRPATVLQMDKVQVVSNKTRDKHGYYAVCIGQGSRSPKNVGRAMMGVFARSMVGEIVNGHNKPATEGLVKEDPVADPESGIPPKRSIREFRVRDRSGLLPIGMNITPSWFQVGQFVDARSHTRGHGFTGVMKRHGMKGQPASHGVSLAHRTIGSVGGGQGSGSRVHPGKKMAGRMGNERHTVMNLEVLLVDNETGIVVIAGPVSGHKGGLVMIQDALRKPWPDVPAPATEDAEAPSLTA